MYVIFDTEEKTGCAMICFYDDHKEQADLMHRLDITKQVKKWLEAHSGNPPRFYSRITIREFTDRELNFTH